MENRILARLDDRTNSEWLLTLLSALPLDTYILEEWSGTLSQTAGRQIFCLFYRMLSDYLHRLVLGVQQPCRSYMRRHPIKLTFFNAARAIIGSCRCVECRGKRILIDCGLQQGRDEQDSQELNFAAGYVDAVMVTRAHIGHSGRIPLLVKQGFTGSVYCTHLTGQLLSIML